MARTGELPTTPFPGSFEAAYLPSRLLNLTVDWPTRPLYFERITFTAMSDSVLIRIGWPSFVGGSKSQVVI